MAPPVIAKLKKAGTTIIAPAAVAQTVTEAKTLANGAKTTWDKWTIEAVPMYNLTRGPQPGKLFHDKGRGDGFVLTYGGKRFYIAGDTEGIPEMRALKNIDVAFVCSGPYVDGHDAFGLELLVAPRAYGGAVYYAYIIAARDSPIARLEDFRGKRFAFTDPLSNTGKLVPTYMLARMNETPESFFKEFVFTKAHDKSMQTKSPQATH